MTTTSFKTIPLLENGDRLTRHEFERRYPAMPDQKRGSNQKDLFILLTLFVCLQLRY